MMIIEDANSRGFKTVAFGGYDMAQVNDFLAELTEDYSALHQVNEKMKKEFDEECVRLRAENEALQARMAVLSDSMDACTTLQSENEALNEKVQALSSSEADCSALRAENETLKGELAALSGSAEACAALRDENEALMSELRMLANNEKACATLRDENEALKARVQELSAQVAPERAADNDIRVTLLDARQTAEAMIHEAEQAEAEKLQAAQAIAAQRMAELKAKIAEEYRLQLSQDTGDGAILDTLVAAQQQAEAMIHEAEQAEAERLQAAQAAAAERMAELKAKIAEEYRFRLLRG